MSVDRPDIVLLGIPLVVVSGYTLSTLSAVIGVADEFGGLVEAIGYLSAVALICWAVWTRTRRAGR